MIEKNIKQEVIMEQKQKRFFDMRIVIGLLIVAAGVLLLLNKMDIGMDFRVIDFWPVILIVIGLGKIIQPKEYRHIYGGIIITAIGTLFLLNNLGYIHFWFKDLWPILLILLGIEILRCGVFKHNVRFGCCSHHARHAHGKFHHDTWNGFNDTREVDKDYIDISVTLGSGDFKFTNKQLKGGQVSVIMAGCELDLRNADMEKDEMTLEISTIMGGVDVRVPSHWEVIVQGNPVLGGVEDKTAKPGNSSKKLLIKASAIMGGIEVNN